MERRSPVCPLTDILDLNINQFVSNALLPVAPVPYDGVDELTLIIHVQTPNNDLEVYALHSLDVLITHGFKHAAGWALKEAQPGLFENKYVLRPALLHDLAE